MMSQHAALSSLFADDPFFGPERLLQPGTLSSLHQDFFSRRSTLAEGLLKELSSSLSGDGMEQQLKTKPSVELQKQTQKSTENNGDLLVTLDARGYAPGDISVRLRGRSLAVTAVKQAGAEESQTCSSASSRASFCSSASSRLGFAQNIELPAHLDLSGLSCSLMDDGQLRVHAPVSKQPIGQEEEEKEEEEQAPARFRSALEFPITKE